MKQIHITTGSQRGIGLEISIRSLLALKPSKNIQFILWRGVHSPSFLKQDINKLYQKFQVKRYQNLSSFTSTNAQVIDIKSKKTPIQWVQTATQLCLKDPKNRALVTAPLSKLDIQKQGFLFKGHTDLLKKISNCKYLYMCFLGKKFNVVLVTDHIPIKQIKLTSLLLKTCIQKTLSFQNQLQISNKPLGLVGFNPHAGENGILGTEELRILNPVLKQFSKKQITGNLIPDICFQPNQWKRFSFYICPYHDQGLIPFKMIHEQSGVHTTLGLPFIRTSPTHGTAEDIFGKNKASYQSIKQSIQTAIKFLDFYQEK